jgi:hypothetical protein
MLSLSDKRNYAACLAFSGSCPLVTMSITSGTVVKAPTVRSAQRNLSGKRTNRALSVLQKPTRVYSILVFTEICFH